MLSIKWIPTEYLGDMVETGSLERSTLELGESDPRRSVAGETHPTGQPFRPIQYLGNKLRSVEAILQIATDLGSKSQSFVDLFTGSTVVAQAFANSDWKVTANDTQAYSFTMANALLGIGRKLGEPIEAKSILELVSSRKLSLDVGDWDHAVDLEDKYLSLEDYEGLIYLYGSLPLYWLKPDQSFRDGMPNIGTGTSALGEFPLITSLQAGKYFGVRQSIEIDLIRNAIEERYQRTEISSWQRFALLTALFAAMSLAVNSAGKHFAQPLLAGSSTNKKFLKKRLWQDRRLSIVEKFDAAANSIATATTDLKNVHCAEQSSAEEFLEKHDSGVDVVYADPPYTAQQYSRFYHLLETVLTYQVPELLHNGKVTNGLYPTNRYKSDFCSRTRVGPAFDRVVSSSFGLGAFLLISYSVSSKNSVGNARMISLQDLTAICHQHYGSSSVECVPMSHRYRQFNSTARSNADRNDQEILIVCRPQ